MALLDVVATTTIASTLAVPPRTRYVHYCSDRDLASLPGGERGEEERFNVQRRPGEPSSTHSSALGPYMSLHPVADIMLTAPDNDWTIWRRDPACAYQ